MQWNLDLYEMDTFNCYDSLIKVLLKQFGFEYKLMDINAFSTSHFGVDEKGEGYVARRIQCNDILKELYQVTIDSIDIHAIRDVHLIVSKELISCPVGLTADPYDCHWSPLYRKVHFSHLLLIVDIDFINKCYICVDIYCQTIGAIRIGFDEIEKLCDKVLLFRFPEGISDIYYKAWNYLVKVIHIPDEKTHEIEKNNLIDYLISLTPDSVGTPNDLDKSLLLMNLMWIAEDKKNFMMGLKYLEYHIGNSLFENVYILLEKIVYSLLLLKNLFMKYAITKNLKIEKVRRIVTDIYSLNREIAVEMKKVLLKWEYNDTL